MLKKWLNISKEPNIKIIPRKMGDNHTFEIIIGDRSIFGDYIGLCTKHLLRSIDLKITDTEQKELRKEMGLHLFNNSMIDEICDGI